MALIDSIKGRFSREVYLIALAGAVTSLAFAFFAGEGYPNQNFLWIRAVGSAVAFFSAAEFAVEDNTGLEWSVKRAFALLNLLIAVFSLPALLSYPVWFPVPFLIVGVAIWRSELERKKLADEQNKVNHPQQD